MASDNYVNDWLEKEKWFTFRTISGNDKWTAKGEYLLLEYRVDIEKLVDSAELCSDGNTSVPVSYPVIIKERTYSDDELWNRSREFMISVGESLKYKYTERKNTDFDTALSDMKDERVLSRQAHPVNNSEKTHESIRTIMKKYSEVLEL